MEILLIILLILLKSDGNKDKLTPLITALLENKELLSYFTGADKSAQPAPPPREEPEKAHNENTAAPENGDGKAEAIEKFLNSYFR